MSREEQIARIKRLREQLATQQADPWYEDLGEGVAVSAMETGYGLKDLLGGEVTDEQRARLEDWKRDAAESGWGTAGRIAGEVGQMAIPGGLGLKAARGLQLAKNLGSGGKLAAKLGYEAGVTGAHGAVKLPGEGESRTQQGLESAAAGAAGGVIGKAVQPLLGRSMYRLSDTAKKQLDEGNYLTPGYAAESPTIRAVESAMSVTPPLARGTKALRNLAEDQWSNTTLKKGVPKRFREQITGAGHEGIEQLDQTFDDMYSKAWGGRTLDDKTVNAAIDQAKRDASSLAVDEERLVNQAISKVKAKFAEGADARVLDKEIRQRMKSVHEFDLTEAMKNFRKNLRKGLPDESLNALKEADEYYPRFLALQQAASTAAEQAGVFTPKVLMQSARTVGGTPLTAKGQSPFQQEAYEGLATVGQDVSGAPLEWFRRLATGAPTPIPMKTIGDFTMGQYGWQKALARRLRDKQEAIAPWINRYRIGAAIEE